MAYKWEMPSANLAPEVEINNFRGQYGFLSNFYDRSVQMWGITFPSSEHAFVAGKTNDMDTRRYIAGLMTAAEAKSFGRRIDIRPDWDEVKKDIMLTILRAKFTQNPDLTEKLIATGDAILVEGNMWHDRIWGRCFCKNHDGSGENWLGELLMKVRSELKEGN